MSGLCGLSEQNSLLRSAYAIAGRKGAETNWDAFLNNLEEELMAQSGGDSKNPQDVLKSTCTPLTYRICDQEKS